MSKPTGYSTALAAEIAERIAEGGSLKGIAQSRSMPSLRTLLKWTSEHPEFDLMLAHARVDKSHVLFDESIDIADEDVKDMVQATRNRLRVQARQYAAARLNPAKYGEKIGIGQAPELPPLHERVVTEHEIARRIFFALFKGAKDIQAEARKAGSTSTQSQPLRAVR